MTNEFKAYLGLVLTAFFWGCNAVFAQLVVGDVSPMLLVSLRWLCVVSLLIVFFNKEIKLAFVNLRPHLFKLFLMGGLGFTIFNVLFYEAAYTTTALNIGIIQGAIPIFILIGVLVFLPNKFSWSQLTGIVLTIFGVMVVASGGDVQKLTELSINTGDYLIVIACLLYASYSIALKKFSKVMPIQLFCILAIAAFIISLPITLIEYTSGNLQTPSAFGWMIILLIALLPSFFAQILFIKGIAQLGPGRAAIFLNLVPVFAPILAIFILGEVLHLYHIVALVLVLGGIVISEKGKTK